MFIHYLYIHSFAVALEPTLGPAWWPKAGFSSTTICPTCLLTPTPTGSTFHTPDLLILTRLLLSQMFSRWGMNSVFLLCYFAFIYLLLLFFFTRLGSLIKVCWYKVRLWMSVLSWLIIIVDSMYLLLLLVIVVWINLWMKINLQQ